jgi:sugar-specific transcriptional regulator TrmB
MLENELEHLGLGPEEAKVYLSVLELGGGYASTLAKQAGVPRVNCYYLLDGLKKKGLVTSNLRGKAKFFVAEPPQVLANQIEEQFKRAQELVPQLAMLGSRHGFKPSIRSYEGMSGIKAIFEQTLEAESELVGYTNLEALGELLPDYLPDYSARLVKKNIKVRWLSPSTEMARAFIQHFYPDDFPEELVEVLFVNPQEFAFENQIAIYGNKVAIISLNPEELMGVIIESPVYARTERRVFNLSWLGATAFVAQ